MSPRPYIPRHVNEWKSRRTVLLSIASGSAYGLALRLFFSLKLPKGSPDAALLMSAAFLFLCPFAIGFLSVHRAERDAGPLSAVYWCFAPWFAVLLMMLATFVFDLEGLICLVMASPIALLGSTLGGLTGGLLARRGRVSRATSVSVALLPLLLAPAESLHPAPTQLRTVHNQVRIHAPAAIVWHNIERVPAIAPAERPTGWRQTWAQRIGFPRPIEATLSHEGVGGVRNASFERGLLFFETVTVWEPNQRLAFHIQADTAHIPPTTLDEHVTIGGPFFDVLDGEYRLEPLANGDILLHLTSHQRLSTDVNGYAGLWSDAVMQSLQTSILSVIQHRCEAARAQTPTSMAHSRPATP